MYYIAKYMVADTLVSMAEGVCNGRISKIIKEIADRL